MKSERNTFVKKVYPVLKEFCASLGLDFQVMDMRWGVTDFATNDHSTTSLCLKEIENCRRLSRGPCFVVCTIIIIKLACYFGIYSES